MVSKVSQQKIDIRMVDEGDYRVLQPHGHLDVYTAGSLRDRLTELVQDDPKTIIVDLDEVSFMDSSGLGALRGAVRRTQEAGGRLAVKCTNQQHLELFGAAGLDDEISVSPTVEEAVAALKS